MCESQMLPWRDAVSFPLGCHFYRTSVVRAQHFPLTTLAPARYAPVKKKIKVKIFVGMCARVCCVSICECWEWKKIKLGRFHLFMILGIYFHSISCRLRASRTRACLSPLRACRDAPFRTLWFACACCHVCTYSCLCVNRGVLARGKKSGADVFAKQD